MLPPGSFSSKEASSLASSPFPFFSLFSFPFSLSVALLSSLSLSRRRERGKETVSSPLSLSLSSEGKGERDRVPSSLCFDFPDNKRGKHLRGFCSRLRRKKVRPATTTPSKSEMALVAAGAGDSSSLGKEQHP